MKFQRGFTLVEILIAISIIGIAFGVVISSASYLQKSSRNTQRQSDLVNIQGALQQYYADQQFFPMSTGANSLNLSSQAAIASNVGNPAFTGTNNVYLKLTPDDPLGSQNYLYKAFISNDLTNTTACDNATSSTTKCQYYILCSYLEDSSLASDADCTPGTFNYKLTPR